MSEMQLYYYIASYSTYELIIHLLLDENLKTQYFSKVNLIRRVFILQYSGHQLERA